MTIEVSRQELYDRVWSQPMRDLAKELGFSDSAIAKHCRRANIPLPGRGHWAKKAAGLETERLELPPRDLGQDNFVTIGGQRDWFPHLSDAEILRSQLPPIPTFEDDLASVTSRAQEIVKKLPKRWRDQDTHPAVAKILADDQKRQQKYADWSWDWRKPLFESAADQRRLQLLNQLAWAMARCGCRQVWADKEARSLTVTVGDQRVTVGFEALRTDHDRSKRKLKQRHKQTEPLQIKVSWYEPPDDIQLQWSDGDGKPLEKQMVDVCAGLLVAGEWMHRYTAMRSYEWRRQRKQDLEREIRRQEEARRRAEREKVLKIERERRTKLLEQAAAWRKAAEVREFVKAVLAQHDATDPRLQEWADWALVEANCLDPLRQPQDVILQIVTERDERSEPVPMSS